MLPSRPAYSTGRATPRPRARGVLFTRGRGADAARRPRGGVTPAGRGSRVPGRDAARDSGIRPLHLPHLRGPAFVVGSPALPAGRRRILRLPSTRCRVGVPDGAPAT